LGQQDVAAPSASAEVDRSLDILETLDARHPVSDHAAAGGWLLTSVIFGLVIARWMRLQKMQDPRAAP